MSDESVARGAQWCATVDALAACGEAIPPIPLDDVADHIREEGSLAETPALALLDEISRLRSPPPWERILCAAIWVDDGKVHYHQPFNIVRGVVFCGWRHHNCIISARLAYPDLTFAVDRHQGFLTDLNRYVGREEAAGIALAAGQTSKVTTHLFSEDVY